MRVGALLLVALAVCGGGARAALREAFAWRQLDFAWPSPAAKEHALATGAFRPEASVPVGLEVWGQRVFVTVPRWATGVPASLTVFPVNDHEGRELIAGNQQSRRGAGREARGGAGRRGARSGSESDTRESRSSAQRCAAQLPHCPTWTAHAAPASRYNSPQTSRATNRWGRTDSDIDCVLPSRVVSPFRLRADSCGRLWVLDTGRADVLGDAQQLAPAALLVFDLRTDQLLRRYEVPRDQLMDSSFLVNLAVDVSPTGCEDTYAYLADMGSYALIVYSWAGNESWRVTHNYFLSHPLQGEFRVAGTRFQWPDGIFGLALSKANRYNHRTLYFHAFASTSEFQVSTEILQNKTRALNSFHEFHLVGDRGPNTQSCASFMDEESGIAFYTQVNLDAITCWNSRTRPHYEPTTIGLVAQDNRTLVFPNDVKVDAGGNVWVLTDRLALFLYSSLDPKDVNFRILTATVQEAVNGTICDPAYSGPEPKLENHPLESRFGGGSLCDRSAATTPAAVAAALAPLLALALWGRRDAC
ncbi:Protein yellow [Gryllus bimaculatus]|nr:Protein yellow [Gryllus bimaculatus]